MKKQIKSLMKMEECNHKSKYLGTPFCQVNSKTEAFQDIVENLKSSWALGNGGQYHKQGE